MTRWQQYIDYINNTGRGPLPVSMFDSDHEPIGPAVRDAMVPADLIQVRADGIYLRPDLIRAKLHHPPPSQRGPMITPEQIPDEVADSIGGAFFSRKDAKRDIAAALNAWPGMHKGHQCIGCGGDPQIILPLTEKPSHE